MSFKDSSTSALMARLAGGWAQERTQLAEEFVACWHARFEARSTALQTVESNALTFTTDLGHIRLRGMDDVHCVLLAGEDAEAANKLSRALLITLAPGRLVFLLSASEKAWAAIHTISAGTHCLRLSPDRLASMLDAREPRESLLAELRQQLPAGRLIPFSILLSAGGNMFYGRVEEVNRLLQHPAGSFAIVGPSRIGKTSLVKEYCHRLVRENGLRATATFYIDLYEVQSKSADEIARKIAMSIDASRRGDRVTADQLVTFLRSQATRLGSPVDLVLDEVDEVCQSAVFSLVAAAAKNGYCRLILCGRGILLKTMLNPGSSIAGRVEMIRLTPLDEASARSLLLEPLVDLGLTVEEPEQLLDRVCRLTGRLPHLIQFYGRKLAELAIADHSGTVSLRSVEVLGWDYETAQYLTSPLSGLADPEYRLVALAILKDNPEYLEIATVQQLATHEGLSCRSFSRAKEVCDDLVINNVLAWHRGKYVIANEALIYYAHQLGYLDHALAEARLLITRRASVREPE